MTAKIVIFYTTAEAVFVAQGARHMIVECSVDQVSACLDAMHDHVLAQGHIFLGASCHVDGKSVEYVPYYTKTEGRGLMRPEEVVGRLLKSHAHGVMPDIVSWRAPAKGDGE
jgi:hypothetical protein